jgi:serine/threonine-protein kinase RIO1
VFKDRDKYVTGEYRFRRGYSRNPRKMVRLWAEKEMRNLKRLIAAGINTPEPIEVRENVLVMGLVGDEEGWQVDSILLQAPFIHSRLLKGLASPQGRYITIAFCHCPIC